MREGGSERERETDSDRGREVILDGDNSTNQMTKAIYCAHTSTPTTVIKCAHKQLQCVKMRPKSQPNAPNMRPNKLYPKP